MKSEIIKPDKTKTYPCLVVEKMTGDGSKPTVYFKPDASTSIVVVVGYFAEQMDYELGRMITSHDPAIQKDRDVERGGPIDEDLPLFNGKVILEN